MLKDDLPFSFDIDLELIIHFFFMTASNFEACYCSFDKIAITKWHTICQIPHPIKHTLRILYFSDIFAQGTQLPNNVTQKF